MAGMERIDPLHDIRLADLPSISSIDWSPDGSTLYVHGHGEAVDVWKLLVHHWPEWGGGFVALVLVVCVLWIVWKLRRRVQVPGAPHCRKCNYELTAHAPGGEQSWSGVCPECGADLSRRPPVIGRKRSRSIIVPILVFLLFAGVYGGMLGFGVPRSGGLSHWRSWPSFALRDFARQRNLQWILNHVRQGNVILAVDPATGAAQRVVYADNNRSYNRITVSPDGDLIFLDGRTTSGGRIHPLIGGGSEFFAIETASGRVRSSVAPGIALLHLYHRPVFAFQDSGRFALVHGYRSGRDVVLRWDLQTGSVDELLAVPVCNGMSREDMRSVTADRLEDPTLIAFGASFTESYDSDEYEILLFDIDGDRLTPRTDLSPSAAHPERFGGSSIILGSSPGTLRAVQTMAEPVPSAWGDEVWIMGWTSVLAHDLADQGKPITVAIPWGLSANWQYITQSAEGQLVVVGYRSMAGDSGFLVRDRASESWAARCPYPDDLLAPRPVLSRSGRWLAGYGSESSRGGASGQQAGAGAKGPDILVIYDLKKLLTEDDASPDASSGGP